MVFESFRKATDPPPTYASSQSQNHHGCPSARSCWPGLTMAAFSPFNCPSRAVLLRRICMCIVLVLDTFVSVLSVVSGAFSFSFIPRLVIAVLHFFGEAWLLHLLGRMMGERVVFGTVYTRWHFDIFLCGLVLCEVALVGWYFGGLTKVTVDIWWGLDLGEFLALLAVAWVAWWGPLEERGWQNVV